MFNMIKQALPRKQAENNSENNVGRKALPQKTPTGFGGAAASPQVDRLGNILGRDLMGRQHGANFARHYYAALAAAGALEGQAFLDQYRSLKRTAREQGMPETEFRSFEKCLYRRFYQAATQDTVRALQSGHTPKVKADELAYIAGVAEIPEAQLQRYTLALQRSEFVGRIKALQA
jgi:hypothetical protein